MNQLLNYVVNFVGWIFAIIGIGFICKLIYHVFMLGWGIV